VPFLGEIEIDPQIRIGGDTGKPVAAMGEDAPGGKSIFSVARRLVERLDQVNAANAGPVLQII
jgi:ATP-binding protein involved in chromosome partitioning